MKVAQMRLHEILDNALLKKGILSHHLRRAEAESIKGKIKINNDVYVVYRKVTHNGSLFGDGKKILAKASFDVTYYYKSNKASDDILAAKQCRELVQAFRNAGWLILGGAVDIYDVDNDFNGITFEVAIQGKKL